MFTSHIQVAPAVAGHMSTDAGLARPFPPGMIPGPATISIALVQGTRPTVCGSTIPPATGSTHPADGTVPDGVPGRPWLSRAREPAIDRATGGTGTNVPWRHGVSRDRVNVLPRDRLCRRASSGLPTIGRDHSHSIIVDLTVIDVLESFASRTLRNLAHMGRLRGADTVIFGINPGVASTMTTLGINLDTTPTALDVDDGIAILDEPTTARHRHQNVEVTGWAGPMGSPHTVHHAKRIARTIRGAAVGGPQGRRRRDHCPRCAGKVCSHSTGHVPGRRDCHAGRSADHPPGQIRRQIFATWLLPKTADCRGVRVNPRSA